MIKHNFCQGFKISYNGCRITPYRVRTDSLILEKVLKFAQQFSRPRKSLENGDKVWKEIKSLVVFQEKELK